MHTLSRAVGLLMIVGTSAIGAQGPGRPGGGPGPGGGMGMPGGPGGGPVGATADFLLTHTGDLALTDAQP